MYLIELHFGKTSKNRSEAENLAEDYLSAAFRAGQVCGEYFVTWQGGTLVVHAMMAAAGAFEKRYHCQWGLETLSKIKEFFGRAPELIVRDDDYSSRKIISKKSPCLYLFTSAFDWTPPVCRLDGKPVPTFLLPIPFKLKEELRWWQDRYILFDQLWLESGRFEIQAYKELAEPGSELSQEGLDLCQKIEKATRIPTYYFLFRYYGRKTG